MYKKSAFILALSCSLSACSLFGDLRFGPPEAPTPSALPTAEPRPTPFAQPTAVPSAEPRPAPSAQPTAVPSAAPQPTAEPTPTPVSEMTIVAPIPTFSPTPLLTAQPTPNPTPLPAATSDVSVIERTSFNGVIRDESGGALDGVTVTARSLNSTVPFEETTVATNGNYLFNNAPAGVQIEITASRPGYNTRRRVAVLKSNQQSDPNANRYDFGPGTLNGDVNNALSDRPEVTGVTPGRNASGIDPKTSFVLRFSEPMDRQSVEHNVVIRAYTQGNLSVGHVFEPMSGSLADARPQSGSKIWDRDAFNISWNSDHTEATFSFADERQLPTDKNSVNLPEYYISFTNSNESNTIQDKSGVGRNGHYFKLTEGAFEGAYKFSITADTQAPALTNITASTTENGSPDGDAIRVRYSKRMIHYTHGGVIAGGMTGNALQAAASNNSISPQAAAHNYQVVILAPGGTPRSDASWGSRGGIAIFDTNDPTHKTALLIPASPGENIFQPGDTVSVTVANTVLDPAGHTLNIFQRSTTAQ